MPISTNPYQPNDYQAASQYQPYKLGTQQIAQTAMALDTFWKQGAARVKSAYDSVLNLNLTSDENREVRDKFMEDAQKQLTKLSSMNLSNPDIQIKGLNIFKPILKDKAIIQDDYLTNLKSQIFSEAERFKRDTKTGGAGYHMDNLAYALKGFQGFNSKTARNQVGDIFEGAKDSQYTPYYDDTKEKMDILKLCKGNKLSNMTNNGPYLETYSDNSLYSSKLYGCLEGGLSQRSRQQNRISGSVRYGNDYDAVKRDYIDNAVGQQKYYKTERDKLNAEKEAKSKVAGNEQQVAALQEQIDMYDEGITKLGTDITTYNSWDAQYLQQNYEDLASNAYFKRVNHSFAESFAIRDVQGTKKADPIYITHYVQNEMNKRQYANDQNQIDLENLKFQHKLALGVDENGNKIGDNLTRLKMCAADPTCNVKQFLTEAVKEPATTSGKIQGQINSLTAERFDILKDMKNDPFVKGIIGDSDYGDLTNFNEDEYREAWDKLNTYANNADNADPNKKKILDVTNKLLELDNRKSVLKGILSDAEGQVTQGNPQIKADYDQKSSALLSTTRAEQLNNGVVLDANKVANIIAGNDSEYTLEYYYPRGAQAVVDGIYHIVDRGGNQVGTLSSRNNNILKDYTSLNSGLTGSYKSLIDNYLGQSTAVQKMGLATGDLFTKGSVGERELQSLFGSNLGVIGEAAAGQGVVFNSIGGLDPVTGKVKIQATNKDGQLTFKEMRNAMAKTGIAQSQYGTRIDDNTMEITLPSAVGIIEEPKYADVLRIQLNYLEKRAGTLPPNGVVMDIGRSATGKSYAIKVNKKIGSNLPEYTLLANGQPSPFYNTNGMDEKENILIQLDRLLNGLNQLNDPNKK